MALGKFRCATDHGGFFVIGCTLILLDCLRGSERGQQHAIMLGRRQLCRDIWHTKLLHQVLKVVCPSCSARTAEQSSAWSNVHIQCWYTCQLP